MSHVLKQPTDLDYVLYQCLECIFNKKTDKNTHLDQ